VGTFFEIQCRLDKIAANKCCVAPAKNGYNSETINNSFVPFKSSSPLVLKFEKLKFWIPQSLMTTFSFASMSFSLLADMHTS